MIKTDKTEMVSKINHILRGLTTCRFTFQSVETIIPAEWNEAELAAAQNPETKPEAKTISSISGKHLALPLFVRNRFVGLGVIEGARSGAESKCLVLADLLTDLLELKLSKEDERRSLGALEERIHIDEGYSRNVIKIRPTRLSRVRNIRKNLEEIESLQMKIGKKTPSHNSLLIENFEAEKARREALRLHEESQRWAFLSLEDLSSDALETTGSFSALGGVTLYIADLAKLSTAQQTHLASRLSEEIAAPEAPRVIAAIRTEDRNEVLPHLISLFAIHAFEIPLSDSLMQH